MPINEPELLMETKVYGVRGFKDEDGIYHLEFISKNSNLPLPDEVIEEIKSNLKDWGKWKEYKKLKNDLRKSEDTEN